MLRRFFPAVRAFARRRVRKADAIDEFSQDALMLVVEALRGNHVEDPERIGGFVLGVCRNLARERARVRDRRAALWEKFGNVIEAVEAKEHDPFAVAILEDCFSQLTARARTLLFMVFGEDEDSEIAAERLQLTTGNARVLRHRSLSQLKECMQERVSWEGAA